MQAPGKHREQEGAEGGVQAGAGTVGACGELVEGVSEGGRGRLRGGGHWGLEAIGGTDDREQHERHRASEGRHLQPLGCVTGSPWLMSGKHTFTNTRAKPGDCLGVLTTGQVRDDYGLNKKKNAKVRTPGLGWAASPTEERTKATQTATVLLCNVLCRLPLRLLPSWSPGCEQRARSVTQCAPSLRAGLSSVSTDLRF